jgi:hypothetical protein
MPKLVWLRLTALLDYRTLRSCMALAEALESMSYNPLTIVG